MIEVQLAPECAARLLRELRRAGADEIGGVLATERIADRVFRIVDLSVQRKGGTFAAFSRDASLHKLFMRRFHNRTGHQYEKFNYLGEWHSHPSFPPLPSSRDVLTMRSLLEAPDQLANFLVLLIVKRSSAGELEASAHAFARGLAPMRVPLTMCDKNDALTDLIDSPRISLRRRLAMRVDIGLSRMSRR